MADTKEESPVASTHLSIAAADEDGNHGAGQLHFAQRGADVDNAVESEAIDGFDAERMRARSALTADEEKKLMRRVDLRIMILCSLIFLIKNLDSANISNARIMNKGTPRNIMTQLNITSDQYSLLTVLYYVCLASCGFQRLS